MKIHDAAKTLNCKCNILWIFEHDQVCTNIYEYSWMYDAAKQQRNLSVTVIFHGLFDHNQVCIKVKVYEYSWCSKNRNVRVILQGLFEQNQVWPNIYEYSWCSNAKK